MKEPQRSLRACLTDATLLKSYQAHQDTRKHVQLSSGCGGGHLISAMFKAGFRAGFKELGTCSANPAELERLPESQSDLIFSGNCVSADCKVPGLIVDSNPPSAVVVADPGAVARGAYVCCICLLALRWSPGHKTYVTVTVYLVRLLICTGSCQLSRVQHIHTFIIISKVARHECSAMHSHQ